MKKVTLSVIAVSAIMGSVSSISADGINILDDVKWDAQIRPRYEFVDDGTTTHDNAQAYTARTKLKATGNLLGIPGLSASIGIISVNDFGSNKYNSTFNGQTQYATVADPEKAMISNAEINYKTCNTLIHAGRGQVNLDNQRFIGTVGWRQLERSYDSIFVANNAIPNLSLLAAWVYGYQGVVGAAADHTIDTNSVLLHAAYDVNPNLKVTVYDYMLASLHDTYGLALTGKVNLATPYLNNIKYRLEYAKQKDPSMKIHDKDNEKDADYYNIDLSTLLPYNNGKIIMGANYEFLSGTDYLTVGIKKTLDPTLGTNHKFNGWADRFLTTPKGGLKDANVRFGYKASGFGKFLVVYHEFAADKKMYANAAHTKISDDLGKEWDAVYVNKIPGYNNLKGMIKYANYSGGDVFDYKNDVKKLWLMLDYKFGN